MTATAIVNEVIDGISWRTDFVIYGMGDTMEIIDFHDGNVLLVGAVKVSQFWGSKDGILKSGFAKIWSLHR